MNYTIFDTAVINPLMRVLSFICLKAAGWSVVGPPPDIPKYVIIAAPHTSNWDLPLTLFTAFILNRKIYWMGKDTIFRKPFKQLFIWLGGIPIDRSKSNNMVSQSIEQFNINSCFILAIPPSGTRKKVSYWKKGFYYIAKGANVPIVLGFLDYRLKKAGLGPTIYPTGNIDRDMKKIRLFYQTITGKYPDKAINSATVKI